MKSFSLYLCDELATVQAGLAFGQLLDQATVIFLEGVLGAGKTTFCRGVLNAFNYSGAVKSPTYTLVEPYDLAGRSLFHFDLYRLGDPEELEYMGIRDYFQGENIALIEWPIRGRGYIPEPNFQVELSPKGGGRQLVIHALDSYAECIIRQLNNNN